MKPGRARRLACALCLVLAAPARSPALDISTSEIAALSLSPGCLDYGIAGTCFFLVCEPLRVPYRDDLPDQPLSAGRRGVELPAHRREPLGRDGGRGCRWRGLVGGLLGAAADVLVDGGHQREGTRIEAHENVRFKEVDVIGNPIASAEAAVAFGVEFLCKSEAQSFSPYFVSTLDAIGWRLGVTELIYPATFIPGLREIGDWPLNTWGSVHPRQGFLNTSEDPKAAAVCAQRAADIVTRESQPHVYVSLGGDSGAGGDCGQGCTPPGPCLRE